jgi:HD-GYP domain-containing protein (c-di-GMP phosphodiesterase class II)
MIFPKKQSIDWGRLNKYEGKKVEVFYIHRSDRFAYKKFLKSLRSELEIEFNDPDKIQFAIPTMIETLGMEMEIDQDIDPMLIDFAQQATTVNVEIFINNNRAKLPALLSSLREAPDSAKHGLMTSIFSLLISKSLRLDSSEDIGRLSVASFLHDIGEVSTAKADAFSLKENHPLRSAQIVDSFNLHDDKMITIVKQHHEREDGQGYPKQLPYNLIEGQAKILAVSDRMAEIFAENMDKENWTLIDTYNEFMKEKKSFNDFVLSGLTKVFAK